MAAANDTKQSVYHDTDEQPGLEVADSTNKLKGFYGPGAPDGLEVVPNQGVQHGKEVVPGSSPPLERRSSLNQPEAWHLPYQQQQPLIEGEKHPAGEGREYDGNKEAVPSSWTKRRYCGMRGKWLAILLAVILLVIIAAVLGGVLGTLLGSDADADESRGGVSGGSGIGSEGSGDSSGNSSQSVTGSRKAQSQSGIAATFLGSNNNTLLTYYQDDSNRIIENVYIDGAWTSDTSSAAAIVANASEGSPLAAISYNYNGTTWRQVFFVADDTSLWTTKATQDGAWEEPAMIEITADGSSSNITGTHVANGPALAACKSICSPTGTVNFGTYVDSSTQASGTTTSSPSECTMAKRQALFKSLVCRRLPSLTSFFTSTSNPIICRPILQRLLLLVCIQPVPTERRFVRCRLRLLLQHQRHR